MPIRHTSIKELRTDRLRAFMDRRLVQAISHPVREHILAVLNERAASSTEIGDELELDVSAFYKHVQLLEALGCIECVGKRRVRGVGERIFRATASLHFDDEAWKKVPATIKADIEVDLLKRLCNDATGALVSGLLGGNGPEHLSWSPGLVDAQGRQEIHTILTDTLARILVAQREAGTRLAESGAKGTLVSVALLGYESDGSGGKPPSPPKRRVTWRRRRPASRWSGGR